MSGAGSLATAQIATVEAPATLHRAPQQNLNFLQRAWSLIFGSGAVGPGQRSTDPALLPPTDTKESKTFLYLAYGSNLSNETFRGKRNIRPLSSVNVLVPELELVFDLPGLPYVEPAFANSRFRHDQGHLSTTENDHLLSTPIGSDSRSASALGWKKGLVGTVYKVTAEDFAHIIATEGAGSGYQDITVDCFRLEPDIDIVPSRPHGSSFKAHTLYAGTPQGKGDRRDGWAEASARYLKLITTGAAENKLPRDYRKWLEQLRPYRTTTTGQTIGKVIMAVTWVPWIVFIFRLQALLADKHGRGPGWIGAIANRVFSLVWLSYDRILYPLCGDGERTIGDVDGQGLTTAEEQKS